MNKDKRSWTADDVDYWKSMVDIIIGLLLVVLLVMALVVLSLLDRKNGKGDYTAIEPSPTAVFTLTPSPTPTPTPTPTPYHDWNNGGGGGHTPSPTPRPTATPSATPRVYDFDKSAVRVMVYDSESAQLLTEENASFTLLDNGQKMTLYVRYPEVKGYSVFSTFDRGSFFLPEKLLPGVYALKNNRLLDKYDLPDKLEFVLEQGRDWSDPFIVKVDAVPCKNIIRLTVLDAETGEPVPGGNYRVIAAEDIIAGDGAIRYQAGERADTLYPSAKGVAVSAELHLGDYRVEQLEPAFGYADEEEAAAVTLKRRRSTDEVTDVQLKVNRTKLVLTVRDGATYARLQGVKFLVTGASGLTECVTDVNGEITLVSLEKNAAYSIVQAESYLDYQYDPTPIAFTVDEKGLIDGKAVLTLARAENRIACAFTLRGKLFPIVASGQRMQLINAEGVVVKEWVSAAEAETVGGVQPGRYTLAAGGRQKDIVVENVSEIQTFELRQWQPLEYVALAGAAAVIVLIVALILILRKRKHS